MMEATVNQNSRLDDVQIHSNLQLPKTTVSIGSEKQYRFVLASLEQAKSTKDLLAICAVTNVGDVAARLRKRGWIIEPVKIDTENRYGEDCDAFYWHILTPLELAKKALREWRAKHPLNEL
jgi:hypothetical protein